MERLIAPNLIVHALACGGRFCAERDGQGRELDREYISELLPPTRHRLQPFLYHSKALQILFRSIPLSPGNSNICLISV